MANAKGRVENLRPFNELPPEEHKALSSKGGKNSAKKRQDRINFNELLMAHLTSEIPKEDESYEWLHQFLGRKPTGADRLLFNTMLTNRSVDAYNQAKEDVGLQIQDVRNFELPAMHIGKQRSLAGCSP